MLVGALLSIAFYGSGAPAWSRNPAADLTGIHTIGVSSNLGDQAEVKFVGVTVFNNKLSQLPIGDWALNDLAARQVGAALAGRFTVRKTPIDDAQFKQAHGVFSGSYNVGDVVRALPPGDIDAYLVLLPGTEPMPGADIQQIRGLGVYSARTTVMGSFNWLSGGDAVVHATYSIYLVRAKTGEVMAVSGGKSPNGDPKRTLADALLMTPEPPSSPHVDTGDNSWPTTAGAFSDVQKQTVRRDLEKMIETSVPGALATMGLAPAASTPSP